MGEDLSTETITCRNCGETGPITGFDKRNDGGKRHRLCKPCRRVYQRRRLQCVNPPAPRSRRIVGATELFICTRCLRSLPAEAFPRKGKDSRFLQSWCRECFSAYKAQRHKENHAREVARIHANQRRLKKANRELLLEYFASHPCVDCGEADPDVLEFDHLRDKRFDVSQMVHTGMSWRAIEAEIAKCDVRCANCHRRKTKQRRLASQVCDPGATRTPD